VPRIRRSRLAAGSLLAVAAAAAAAWAFGLFATDSARPAPAGSTLARFRAEDPHPRGGDGVYAYRTSGGESIDLLGGSRHRYPAETTITLVRVPCGVRLRWDALVGRSTTWTLCTSSRGVAMRGLDEVHTFFASRDETSYACTQRGDAFSCRAARAAEAGSESVAGAAAVEVGGVRMQALHVRTTATVSGGSNGVETVDWWLEPKLLLPLRVAVASRTSRAEPVVGTAHYREDAALRLVSTTPER
jgi:hypothetical protein